MTSHHWITFLTGREPVEDSCAGLCMLWCSQTRFLHYCRLWMRTPGSLSWGWPLGWNTTTTEVQRLWHTYKLSDVQLKWGGVTHSCMPGTPLTVSQRWVEFILCRGRSISRLKLDVIHYRGNILHCTITMTSLQLQDRLQFWGLKVSWRTTAICVQCYQNAKSLYCLENGFTLQPQCQDTVHILKNCTCTNILSLRNGIYLAIVGLLLQQLLYYFQRKREGLLSNMWLLNTKNIFI